jgi:hypothetical protein
VIGSIPTRASKLFLLVRPGFTGAGERFGGRNTPIVASPREGHYFFYISCARRKMDLELREISGYFCSVGSQVNLRIVQAQEQLLIAVRESG